MEMNDDINTLPLSHIEYDDNFGSDPKYISFSLYDLPCYLVLRLEVGKWFPTYVLHDADSSEYALCPLCHQTSYEDEECTWFHKKRVEKLYERLSKDPSIRMKVLFLSAEEVERR